MRVVIAKTDGTNGVKYTIEGASHFEMILAPAAPELMGPFIPKRVAVRRTELRASSLDDPEWAVPIQGGFDAMYNGYSASTGEAAGDPRDGIQTT